MISLRSGPGGGYLKHDLCYYSALDVCPVDCIHPTTGEEGFEEAEMLYINPDECIDCGACEPACPVTAIFEESAVPEEWKNFTKINADFFNS